MKIDKSLMKLKENIRKVDEIRRQSVKKAKSIKHLMFLYTFRSCATHRPEGEEGVGEHSSDENIRKFDEILRQSVKNAKSIKNLMFLYTFRSSDTHRPEDKEGEGKGKGEGRGPLLGDHGP